MRQLLEETKEAEQEAFDNMPESLQQSEKGSAMEDAVASMEDALSNLDGVEEALEF